MTRRRGCGPLGFAVAAVLLLAVLVGVDRVAVGRVESFVGENLRTEMGLTQAPSVDIQGFPFLTQVAANQFGRVELSGRGIPAGTPEHPLQVDRMDLRLGAVTTADSYRRISAGELAGEAYVTWAEVSNQAGMPVTPQDGGRVRVDIAANLYGQQVPFVVSARPVLDVATQRVRLTEPQVLVASYRLPDPVVQRIADESVPPIELNLPMGLTASDLVVGPDYLELGLSGSNIQLVG